MTRSYIDFGNGVISINASGHDDSAEPTQVTPPLKSVVDVSEFGALDIEVRLLSAEMTGTPTTEEVTLHFESSMQDTDEAFEYWAHFSDDHQGLDLVGIETPFVFSFTQSTGVLRYVRWRVQIAGREMGPAIGLQMVFQIRGYGRD